MTGVQTAAAKSPAPKAAPKQAPAAPASSPGAEHVAFQLINTPAAQSPEEGQASDAAEAAVAEASPYGIIIEDGLPAGQNQVNRTAFLDALAPRIEQAADTLLVPADRHARDCPYLMFWIRYYRGQSAAHIERAIQRYVRPDRSDREGIEEAILAHVREAVAAWVDRREVRVPGEVDWRVDDDLIGTAGGEGAVAQHMGAEGGVPGPPGSAAAIRGQLSTGRPLDPAVRTRMERGFGTSFRQVRVHTDSQASSVAHSYRARAFAIGQDIGFGSGQYHPGTFAGDLLLAHELAHTIQQRSAVAEGPALDSLETDATQSALGAMFPDTMLEHQPRLSGGLGLRRCGTGEEPPPMEVDRAEYEATIEELRALYVRKRGVITGTTPPEELEQINEDIAEITGQLHEWGVQISGDQLMRAVEASTDLLTVQGSMTRIPSAEVYFGQRIQFYANIDYVPMGRTVETAWRWRGQNSATEYQFFTASGRGNRTNFTLDELFWEGATSNSIHTEHGLEVIAYIYFGSETSHRLRLTSGWVPLADTIPSPLAIQPDEFVIIRGSRNVFRIADWNPTKSTYSVDWDIDGTTEATDSPVLTHDFPDAGSPVVTARVYRVRRRFGIQEKTLLGEASQGIQVQDPHTAGQQALDLMTTGEPLPTAGAQEASIESSIADIERHVDIGGEQTPYWEDRLEAQETRLRKFREFIPGAQTSQSLPADISTLDPAIAYTAPIPAVLAVANYGGAQPLNIYLSVRHDGSNWNASLVDVTGAEVVRIEDSHSTSRGAIEAVFRLWVDRHPYPRHGRVLYQFSPQGWTLPAAFDTNNTLNLFEAWLDGILEVGTVIFIGLLMVAPTGGLTQLLGTLLLAASVVRSTTAIAVNLSRGSDVADSRNVLEAVSILTSLVGISGAVLRRVGVAAVRGVTYRVGSWMVASALVADGLTLVYLTSDAWSQIEAIRADPTLDEGQKLAQTLRLMTTLLVRGAMLIVSNREMFRKGLRKSDFFRTDPRTTADTFRTGQATGAPVSLEPGARLDVAGELRTRGDTVARLTGITDRELVERYSTLPWLEASLTRAEMAPLLSRLSTPSLIALGDIEARQATSLLDSIADDAIVNAMAPRLRGTGLQSLLTETSPAGVRDLHAAFGTEGLEQLVNEVSSPNIGRLMQGMTAAELKTRSGELTNPVLRNYGADLTGSDLTTLITTHGVPLVKWAGTDQAGTPASALLTGVQKPALEGLAGIADPAHAITGARATTLVTELGADLVNRAAPRVGGRDLATLADALGPQVRGFVENRVVRGEAELAGPKRKTQHFNKLTEGAANLRAALTPVASGGTGELISPAPLTGSSFIMDTNYFRNLVYIQEKVAAGTALTAPETVILADWNARTAGGAADPRVGPVSIAESAADPRVPRTGFTPLEPRTGAPYKNAITDLNTVGAGGAGSIGAPDRTLVSDALFSVPAGSPAPLLLSSDRDLCLSLARNFGTPAVKTIATTKGYAALVANGTFTIELPSVPGRSLQVKPF